MPIAISGQKLRTLLAAFMTSDGTPTGTSNWIGNYSAVAQTAFWGPPPGITAVITSFQIGVGANGKLLQTGWGHLPALTKGVDIRATLNGADVDLSGNNLFDNNDIVFFGAGNVTLLAYAANKDTITSTLNLENTSPNAGVVLNGDTSDRLRVILNDNFTGLLTQRFIVRGYF